MRSKRKTAGLLALLVVVAALGPVAAASADSSDSATVKLIQLLIAKGILSKDQAASLLAQAQAEATARTPARPVRHLVARPGTVAAEAPPPAPPPVLPQGTVRVTYVPPIVRDQIAAQVRDEVLGEEHKEGWAAPGLPDWMRRITVYGDIRLRGERILQDPSNKTNATVGGSSVPYPFPNYDSINTGSPFDINNPDQILPTLNSTEDRTLYRVRARLGVKADISDWLTTDIRLASGNDSSPVSENQTLGQTGDFSKYSIWIDRAYALLKVPQAAFETPGGMLQAYLGRFGNPFWTTDLDYADDVNFDGAALKAVAPIAEGLDVWATGGAFEVYNTDVNYANQLDSLGGKFRSRDKYLFAGQVGTDWEPTPSVQTKFAVGLFDYQNIQGALSSPCLITTLSDVCNTDSSRPQFQQFGNTVFPIRNVVQIPGQSLTESGNSTVYADPQYYGLASRFNVLDLHGSIRINRYDPVDVMIEGEYSKNLAFSRSYIINRGPANNLGGQTADTFAGGDTAWMIKLELGKPEITRRNEWNVYLGYKHLDTDSVLDALTDSDFHLGGTNARGLFGGVDYGVARNTYVALRWYSANTITGPEDRNDLVQVDLNSKF